VGEVVDWVGEATVSGVRRRIVMFRAVESLGILSRTLAIVEDDYFVDAENCEGAGNLAN
jgi:hypothetical protein